MTEREKILGRIREALKAPAAPPGHGIDRQSPTKESFPSSRSRQWLPFVGNSVDEQLNAFRQNTANLKADFHVVNSLQELAGRLLELRDAEGWKRVASHAGELTEVACRDLALPVCRTDCGYKVEELEGCNAGITECDALIAQTGSVLLTSHSAGGRALSVLPPHHIVLARREQLVPDLPAAFELLKKKYDSDYSSMISFVTGPSRTGDIERILVLGAHGPKKLTIFAV